MRFWYQVTRDTAALVGLGAAIGFYRAERSGWWLIPATLLLAAIWYVIYKISVGVQARRARRGSIVPADRRAGRLPHLGVVRKWQASTEPAVSLRSDPRHSQPSFQKPPKSARYTYTLLEDGVPVGVEYDKRAVDNWLAFGENHDVEGHRINAPT